MSSGPSLDHIEAGGPHPTVRPGTDLDYLKLLSFLSSPQQLPCSLLVRNVLLHPLVSVAARDIEAGTGESDEPSPASLLSATWEDYSSSMPTCRISAIGNVQQALLAEATSQSESGPTTIDGTPQSNGNGDGTDNEPWALLRIASSRSSRREAPNGTENDDTKLNTQKNGPGDRISILLWLSSEKELNRRGVGALGSSLTLSQSAAVGDPLAQKSLALLRWILVRFIPDTLRKHCADRLDTAMGGYQSLFAGVNGLIAEEITSMAGEPGKAPLSIVFQTSCTLFLTSVPNKNESQRLDLRDGILDDRWRIDTVKESDLSLMQSRNHIAFPLGYMRHCALVSVILRDMQIVDTISGDPKPVGWCMMHENGALATLWLEREYRGVRTVGQRSLGDVVTTLTAEKIARAHRLALHRLPMKDLTEATTLEKNMHSPTGALTDPAAVAATTEQGNPLGLRFFERCGYAKADGPVTWMGVSYHSN